MSEGKMVARSSYVKDADDQEKLIQELRKNNGAVYGRDGSSLTLYSKKVNRMVSVEIDLHPLEIDEKLSDEIKNLIPVAYTMARQLTKEPVDDNSSELRSEPLQHLRGIIDSVVQMHQYVPKSVFYLIAEIFVRVATKHALLNGNKRTAFFMLIAMLNHLGYYLLRCESPEKGYAFHAEKVAEFVETMQGAKENAKYEQEIQKISDWISQNCSFDFEWEP